MQGTPHDSPMSLGRCRPAARRAPAVPTLSPASAAPPALQAPGRPCPTASPAPSVSPAPRVSATHSPTPPPIATHSAHPSLCARRGHLLGAEQCGRAVPAFPGMVTPPHNPGQPLPVHSHSFGALSPPRSPPTTHIPPSPPPPAAAPRLSSRPSCSRCSRRCRRRGFDVVGKGWGRFDGRGHLSLSPHSTGSDFLPSQNPLWSHPQVPFWVPPPRSKGKLRQRHQWGHEGFSNPSSPQRRNRRSQNRPKETPPRRAAPAPPPQPPLPPRSSLPSLRTWGRTSSPCTAPSWPPWWWVSSPTWPSSGRFGLSWGWGG